VDNLSVMNRAKNMSHIRSRNTKPEVLFRKKLWSMNIRGYRVNPKNIYGQPDIYFHKRHLAIFIDGCFWHKCPKDFILPKSNLSYWIPKIGRNVERDIEVNKELEKIGIKVIRYWEHQIRNNLEEVINDFIQQYEKQEIKNN